MNTHQNSESPDYMAASFALGASPSASGVTSLDSPLVNQTKAEIRTLAAEMAKLAHAEVSPDEFFDGFLPRLTVAMGASAAAVWSASSKVVAEERFDEPESSSSGQPLQLDLIADHMLPAELCEGSGPSGEHAKVLKCALAEGHPILVPPKSVTLEVERPANPLRESIIMIPVSVEDNAQYLLEVVQKSSGGPAAQRGYLRFVAQMADLMADFLRRQKLRNLAASQSRVLVTERWLLRVAEATTLDARAQIAASGLCDLWSAERVFILTGRGRLMAISGVSQPDPRSEVVQTAKRMGRLIGGVSRGNSLPKSERASQAGIERLWLAATERRQGSPVLDSARTATDSTGVEGRHDDDLAARGNGSASEPRPDAQKTHDATTFGGFLAVRDQQLVDEFCLLLRCRKLLCTPLHSETELFAIAGFPQGLPTEDGFDESRETREKQIAAAFGALLSSSSSLSWRDFLPGNRDKRLRRTRVEWATRWAMRALTLALFSIAAMMPVPQHVAATAILTPLTKRSYYAPSAGVISEVFVDEGTTVSPGQPLLKLTSRELNDQIDQLQGELRVNQDRIRDVDSRLSRPSDLTRNDKVRLEGELQELRTTRSTLDSQLQILESQRQELLVMANMPGRIATWDLRNQLLDRPVARGQLLASTFEEQGPWVLQVSIPDQRVGIVTDAIRRSESGLRVQYSLTSNPDQIRDAFLIKLASRASRLGAVESQERFVKAEAILETESLPIMKDGALARVTIECGTVPAFWLVCRDAYTATSTRLRMLW